MAQAPGNLDNEFGEFLTERTRVRCATCKLPPEMLEWVDAKIRAGNSAMSLAQFLNAKGFPVSQSAVINHRNSHVAR